MVEIKEVVTKGLYGQEFPRTVVVDNDLPLEQRELGQVNQEHNIVMGYCERCNATGVELIQVCPGITLGLF